MSVIGTKRRSQGIEFTSAYGRAAEVYGWTASAAFDANDPYQSRTVRAGCDAARLLGAACDKN